MAPSSMDIANKIVACMCIGIGACWVATALCFEPLCYFTVEALGIYSFLLFLAILVFAVMMASAAMMAFANEGTTGMTSTTMASTTMASTDEQGTALAPPPSYIVVMEEIEEGLPSYQEAVMKQKMVSEEVKEEDILPSNEEVYRVGEEGTEVTALEDPFEESLDEVLEEALDEVKVEEEGTEISVLEETLEEVKVTEEKLNSTTVLSVVDSRMILW